MADIKDNSETKKSNAISLFEKYHEEISKLTSIDEFNMKQTQLELPSHRH